MFKLTSIRNSFHSDFCVVIPALFAQHEEFLGFGIKDVMLDGKMRTLFVLWNVANVTDKEKVEHLLYSK
eukprot:gene22953-biopygen8334